LAALAWRIDIDVCGSAVVVPRCCLFCWGAWSFMECHCVGLAGAWWQSESVILLVLTSLLDCNGSAGDRGVWIGTCRMR